MKRLLLAMLLMAGILLPSAAKDRSKQVIAHRGYWKTEGSAQNSISSLRNTHDIGVYGAEFDVHITRDGVVVVFHDDCIEGIKIEDANYADIKDKRLKNGERIPTLNEYLDAAKTLGRMKLILEIKEHANKNDEDRCLEATLRQVKEAQLEKRTEYISFSRHACDWLVAHAPKAKVAYLKGDLSPKQAKEAGYTGIDYERKVYNDNPSWMKEAKKLHLTTNVWTVNAPDEIKNFFLQGVDFVTTNEPVKAKSL